MKTVLMRTPRVAGGMVLGLLLTLGAQLATAQVAAPTAGLIPGHRSFAAGAQASFEGRGFVPGEVVAFQVTHVRGTPVTGPDHTPAAVVADTAGAFVATWLVCATDCVGELLQIEATGQTSGRVGRALFMDLTAQPGPDTWVRTDKADYAPGTTANITGAGFQAGEAVLLQVRHADGTPDSGVDHEPWVVFAGADGGLTTTWHVCVDDCLGSTLRLTALGQASGRTAQAIFTDATGPPTFVRIMSFGTWESGVHPFGLTQGADGALYGTTAFGGSGGGGTVFKLNPDGTGFTVLHNFDYSTTGASPYAALVQGTDGALYGAAYSGGSNLVGTVFKLNPDGSGFTVLHNFDYSTTGAYPWGALMQGTDGGLYGTTSVGGGGGAGTVFKLNPNGTGFTVLKNFDHATGGYPFSWLIQGTDGALYGTTNYGGPRVAATVFKLNPDGTGFAVLVNLDYETTGAWPIAGLMQGTDGALYGTTEGGGSDGYGTLFKLNPDGTGFTVLRNLDNGTSGRAPYGGLVQGTDGALYGTASRGGSGDAGTVFRLNPDGSDFAVLQNFDNGADGGYPYAGLARGADGHLYGTTFQGGDAGFGTVFRLVFEVNHPPVARCKDVTLSAGPACAAAASVDDGSSDPDAGSAITLAQSSAGPYPLGSTVVTLTVTDNHGASNTCTATVTVNNPAPVVTLTGPPSGGVYPVNSAVAFTGTWTDANGGAHTAQWSFDGVPDASFTAGTGTAGSANTSHTFTAAGVYLVELAITDACGATGTAHQVGGVDALVVVYDPNAGFVTGGGWINSPVGAYAGNPALAGKANFGFVSKYKKGATIPTGETEFQYKVGNLNFHSANYDWLVVSGARAQYKGSGTINNAGDYGFMLTCVDGQISGGGGQDKFRMKITDRGSDMVVYDNQLGASDSDDLTTALGGGSIVIHTDTKSSSAMAGESREEGDHGRIPVEYEVSENYPNPFDRSTRIDFSLPERSQVSLVLYDLAGRAVRIVADGEFEAGRHSATVARTSADGWMLGAGVYFLRMNAQSLAGRRSFSSLRKLVLME